ncbi:GerAB/ArcD/ProY family transporter [Paenibacillus montanisoli]|uniref:Uncharacterized protein n=1 Tax=Paenibacillus montanisoli TaxID=2081970 RepID=A0A328U9H1_9BACL|nr:endospore germination permease [Paenibacillus montanisoli]RAP77565.1 hypothetical protein DL346_03545 [Paenibacillus montanisoli]
MKRNRSRISQLQLFTMVAQIMIGTEVISLPHSVHENARQDSWMAILIAGAIVQLVVLLQWGVMRRHPGLTFFEISEHVLGKWISRGIALLYTGYFMFVNMLSMLNTFSVLYKWAYPQTPKWVTLGLVLLVGVYMGRQSVQAIARFFFLVTILHLFFILILLLSHGHGDWLNLLPVGRTPVPSILLGAKSTLLALLGFEVLLIVQPKVKGQPSKKLRNVSLSIWYVIAMYILITMTCLFYLSSERLDQVPEPVMYMLSRFTVVVIERLDMIFLSFWIVSAVTSFVGFLYMGSESAKFVCGGTSRHKFVLWVGLVPFVLALVQNNPFAVANWTPYLELYALVTLALLPLVILVGSLLKQGGGRGKAA